MRITFIIPCTSLDGGIRVVANYAENLGRRGHEILVVSVPPRDPMKQRRGREDVTGDHSHFDGLQVNLHVIERFRPIRASDVPDGDVVVATWWETAEWVSKLPVSKGAKAYFIQGFELDTYPKWWHRRSRMRLEATWRLPMRKIVVSRWLARVAAERFGDMDAVIVPNGVDPARFQAARRNKQLRPTVGFVYSPASCKGCDLILEAVAIARKSLPSLSVVSFGSKLPTHRRPLPSWVDFRYQPRQCAIPAIYSHCDAWLFGSRAEGFGLPILEAMACRTPVIATPAGAAPEISELGGCRLVEPNVPEEMARSIVEVCNWSPEKWLSESDLAFRTAASFSCEEATSLMEEGLKAIARATPA